MTVSTPKLTERLDILTGWPPLQALMHKQLKDTFSKFCFTTLFLRACAFFPYPQRKGQDGYDPDFDEESTMVEDSVTPSK